MALLLTTGEITVHVKKHDVGAGICYRGVTKIVFFALHEAKIRYFVKFIGIIYARIIFHTKKRLPFSEQPLSQKFKDKKI